jgi:DNA-binding transcriptional ArsR family regulator
MHANARILALAQALADPLRLAILQRLLEGPASVAVLMAITDAAQSRVSNHLALLRESDLVRRSRLGRQAIYELSNPLVAELVESLVSVADDTSRALRPSAPLVVARTCYDHLAGRYGVALFAALVAAGALAYPAATPVGRAGDTAQPALGPSAETAFGALGVDLAQATRTRRRLAIACVDWTERGPHLGGALGAALWRSLVERGWLLRQPGTREVIVTPAGRQGLERILGVRVEAGGR